MKSALFFFLLSALLLLGCNETPIQPVDLVEPVEPADSSYELIQMPARPPGGPSFSATETIDGDKGGYVKLKESYITTDGDTVYIDVKLKIKNRFFASCWLMVLPPPWSASPIIIDLNITLPRLIMSIP